jgi:hypothetical protein
MRFTRQRDRGEARQKKVNEINGGDDAVTQVTDFSYVGESIRRRARALPLHRKSASPASSVTRDPGPGRRRRGGARRSGGPSHTDASRRAISCRSRRPTHTREAFAYLGIRAHARALWADKGGLRPLRPPSRFVPPSPPLPASLGPGRAQPRQREDVA